MVNVAGGGELGVQLNLNELLTNLDADFKEYEPETFAGLTIRFQEESPTIIAFNSGKYNIAGASSIEELHNTHREFAHAVATVIDYNINIDDKCEVRSFVYVDSCSSPLETDRIVSELENATQDSQFAGIKYSPLEIDGNIRIFSSGKITLTGTTARPATAEKELEELKDRICPHR